MADPLLDFHHSKVKDGTFRVRQAQGTEEMSGLYRFELELFAQNDRIEHADMLMQSAWLTVRQAVRVGSRRGTGAAKIHGLVSEFEQQEKIGEWARYRAVLVPRLWKLTLAQHNRVFRDISVKNLVEEQLQGAGLKPRVSISTPSPVREFIVQYRETDFEFLSRWLEHEGIFLFFEQGDSEETAVLGDNTAVHKKIQGESAVQYEPDATSSTAAAKEGAAEGVITAFSLCARALPEKVVLSDWDDRQVEEVKASETVDSKGFGKVYEYGCHPQDASHAKALAKARAEAIKCRGKIFSGNSWCRFFRAGATFKMENHFRHNGDYLLTRVVHKMSQPVEVPRVKELPDAYENEFQCIPADVCFRPERITPWPRIHGFTDAIVTQGGGKSGEGLDDQGSYHIRMMYDKDNNDNQTDSNAVRMAQPYAGESYGMHFPLHIDTEVVVGHKDGNPDRPVILSAIPNPKKKSPVVDQNITQSMIQTGGGNMIRLEDKDDGQDFFTYAKKDKDSRTEKDEKKFVGQDKHSIVKRDKFEKVEGANHVTVQGDHMAEIKGDRHISVEGGQTVGIGSGGLCISVQGAVAEDFQMDHSENVALNYYIKALGVVIESTSGITLKCGGSSVVIDMSGVTIKGGIVTLDAGMAKINMGPGPPAQSGSAGSKKPPMKPQEPQEAAPC